LVDDLYIFMIKIMLGIPNTGANIAMTNRAVAFNDARLDRLEKTVSNMSTKKTLTFVPANDIAVINTTTTPSTVIPTFVAKSSVRSVNEIDSAYVYTTGSGDLNGAISGRLGIGGLNVTSMSIRANLLPFNLTNTTTVLSNGMTSDGFYFTASACGGSIEGVTSTYLGGTPISMLQTNQCVWISEALADKLIDDIEEYTTSGIIKQATNPNTGANGFQLVVGYTDSILKNTLIMCRIFSDGSNDTTGASSIVVEYE
jgi:hypothetical protein